MALILKTNESIFDPSGVIPFIEKDPAIVRGVTLGLIDFSNPACLPAGYVAGTSLPSGASYPTLTNGGSAATGGGAFGAGVTNGGLNGGAVAAPSISLPDANFSLSADGSVTRALIVLWAKLKSAGYPASGSVSFALVAGDCNATSNSRGYMQLVIDGAGNVAGAGWGILGGDAPPIPAEKINGEVHQYALEMVKDESTGAITAKLYIDKNLIGSAVTTSPSFGAPTDGNQRLFSDGAFSSASGIHSGNKIYRYAVHNLSSRPDLTAAEMLARDWDSTIGYVS